MAGVLIGLALLAFWLYSVFDVITTPEDDVRNVPKTLWLLIVALIPLLGGIFWLMYGRPNGPGEAWQAQRQPASRQPAPKGPDDDPDFLRDLDRRMRGED
ncbi:PLD nuclease N-terminal domain-containing protein [Nonomuraea sp. NPDC005983]|uniref:PLD nuclease N-terminal domain-containing protein n=1 Tax=Nonomuraea sp. NPDC005983 TaxID=3155595 RepID=UPI0033B73824